MGIIKKLFGDKKVQKKQEAVQKSAVTENIKTGLDTPIEEVKKQSEGGVSLGRSIFPVIKRADDEGLKMVENISPLVTTEIADGIVVCYVMDIGDKLERMSVNHLKQFNLDVEMVHNTAIRNLLDKVNLNNRIGVQNYSSQLPESKPFYTIEFDSNYNPSIMLLDEFWDTTAKEITKSDLIAVSIPATNIIFFSDFNLMESFRTMRPVANSLYNASIKDRLQLTTNTYIRKNGKWIKFLDTDDQYLEIMGY